MFTLCVHRDQQKTYFELIKAILNLKKVYLLLNLNKPSCTLLF